MKDNFTNNNNDNFSDSSIFRAQIREQDLSKQEGINAYKSAAEELFRKDFLKKQELQDQALGHVDGLLSRVELKIGEDEDYFADGIVTLLAKIFKFFNFTDSELEVDPEPQIYSMIKKKRKESQLASIIEFLNKIKKLIKAVFSRDLSFGEKIENEIKELQERLFGGGLSPEEELAIFERLQILQNLKLKLQMFVVGWVISALAEMFGVELTALVEAGTSKEEDRKAEPKEKTSLKEKEACEDVEIKIDAKEKPVPLLFDFSSGVAKPIPLTKLEFDILPKSLKDMLPLVPKEVTKEENREVPKPKEVKEDKQAAESKKQVRLQGVPWQTPGTSGQKVKDEIDNSYEADSGKLRRRSRSNGNKARRGPAPNPGSFPKVDHFQVPSEIDGRSHANAKNEPKQSSMDNSQENPRSELNGVFRERVKDQSVGKA